MRRVLSGILFACAGACATCGQTPLKGVVWDHAAPPTMDELVAMRAAGIEAVRLPLMTDLDLYSSADTVGLALFQDLPYAFLAARALDDQYLEARTELLKALALGSGHPSSKHYGLAVLSDTSDPDACTFMARLAASIRAVQGARSYYVSAFPAHDQCAEHVDLVLLEARNDPDPTRLINEWPAATAVGIGALGVLRRPDVYGLSQPDSPQSQARYLETHLTSLMQSPAAAVFVYRWQDPAGHVQSWGLTGPGGESSPAFSVTQGIFTGRQRVFAFDAGTAPGHGTPWRLLLGWGALALGVLTVASSALWQRLLTRSFSGHSYYQASLREGRETVSGLALVFGTAQGLVGAGLVSLLLAGLMDSAAALPLMEVAARRPMVDAMLQHPAAQVSAVTAGHVAFLLGVSLIVALENGQRWRFQFGRIFTMTAVAHWPVFLLLPLIMIWAASEGGLPARYVPMAAATWLFIVALAGLQCARDLMAVLAPRGRLAAFTMVSLALLPALAVLAAFLHAPASDQLRFWWHLITRH